MIVDRIVFIVAQSFWVLFCLIVCVLVGRDKTSCPMIDMEWLD